jgi:hypothetical protein
MPSDSFSLLSSLAILDLSLHLQFIYVSLEEYIPLIYIKTILVQTWILYAKAVFEFILSIYIYPYIIFLPF